MGITTIERAFELARSGRCRTLVELKARLRHEGFEQIEFHFGGRLTKRQLRDLMAGAPGPR